jgi:glutamate 5-kinase
VTQREHKQRIVPLARRVVVKIGSGVLTDAEGGLDAGHIDALAGEIAALHAGGRALVVVTSGAVAAGVARLGLAQRPRTIPAKQAAAAVGQIGVMSAYEAAFASRGIRVAQVLLTRDDLSNRRRYLNAKHAMMALLDWRVIPVVNENDTVVVDEIKLGDNDNLSALTATLVEADLLIILSDVDGLHTRDPRLDPAATLVPLVPAVTADVEAMAGDGRGRHGTGGMATKLAAAKQASLSGIPTVIADGRRSGVLAAVLDGGRELGTLVLPVADRMTRRKHWIAYSLKPSGALVVDDGARRALATQGRSLLPSGVREVRGSFGVGACVQCLGLDGEEFARGLVSYSAAELEKIRGRHSRDIEALLGYKVSDEIIHRDDLVLDVARRASPDAGEAAAAPVGPAADAGTPGAVGPRSSKTDGGHP